MRMEQEIELLVLDAHGIILNAYWPTFLHEVALHTGESHDEVNRRWHNHVRDDAWSGRINDHELWQRLTLSQAGIHDWCGILESGYTVGPAAQHLSAWSRAVPIWLLSNHRTHWLLPRLERFDLIGHFDRVLVSDKIGATKPDPSAFGEVLNRVKESNRILFVDDHRVNVAVAQRLGIQAICAEPHTPWESRVDDMLGLQTV